MPRNTFWKGHLKLSLVTAAVTLSPATTESGKVRFNILNKQTGNRVESRYVDSVTHRAVADKNQVRGFPRGDDDYVYLEDDEIQSVGLESTRTIDIDRFVPKNSIDWIWYDRPHFLLPADKVGTEAFCVIREAMSDKDVVGISRLVLYRREHAVLLEPSGKGIILWTLHYGDEVREPIAHLNVKAKVDKETRALIERSLAGEMLTWKSSLVQDPVQKGIKKLLKSKEKTQTKPATAKPKPQEASSAKVVNIMDALKKSIRAEKR